MIPDKAGHRVQGKSGIAQTMKNSMFCKCHDLPFQEICTKQENQILRASVAVQTYGLKNKRVVFTFLKLFRGNQCPVGYPNGGKCLQRAVQASQRWLSSFDKIEVLSTLEFWLFFSRSTIFRISCLTEDGESPV